MIHLLYDRIEDDCFHIDTESMIKKHATYLERSSTVVNRPIMTANSSIIQAVMIHIESIRSKNISTRIHDLFIDIDLLGNYTNSRWFSNLARQDYIVLYRVMYEIWYYRGGLSRDMRHRICVLEDPFSHMRNMRIDITSLSRQQLQEFCLHIFEYLVYCGIDDGPIVGMQKFDITPWDSCHTLHLKNTLSMIKLCEKYIPKILKNSIVLKPQLDNDVSYYPKRIADDGVIYWSDSTINIYNLIRAVTSPFPGAFTFLNGDKGSKVIIWDGVPFDSRLDWSESNSGEILEVFYDKSFVVKTGDTTILVTKYEGIRLDKNNIGMFFSHSNIKRKEWIGLPI